MTDKLREAAQAIVDRWDSPAWGGSAENLRHTGEYIAELRAALAQQDAQNAADEVWRKLFWQAALKLKCLPSSYPDANGHVLRAIDRLMGSENAQQDAQAVPTQRQYEMALRQWDHWKSYALELQAKLVKYEGGSPMVLNAAPTQPCRRNNHD